MQIRNINNPLKNFKYYTYYFQRIVAQATQQKFCGIQKRITPVISHRHFQPTFSLPRFKWTIRRGGRLCSILVIMISSSLDCRLSTNINEAIIYCEPEMSRTKLNTRDPQRHLIQINISTTQKANNTEYNKPKRSSRDRGPHVANT